MNPKEHDIYKRTFDFAVQVVRLCQALDERPGTSRVLAKQLLRSGISIGANLREAKGGQSRPDFVSKCSIACKEAHETLYWLELLSATEVIPANRLTDLTRECDEIVSILTTIIKRTKDNSK